MTDCRSCACGCHVPLAQRLEALGVSLDAFTPTEAALLDALLPPGQWRSRERLLAGIDWDDTAAGRHALRVNLTRLRPVLHAAHWDVQVRQGVGSYRVVRCLTRLGEPCPRLPTSAPLPNSPCIECGTKRWPRRHRNARRCPSCLERWRAQQVRVAEVPRCQGCGELVMRAAVQFCKACRESMTPFYRQRRIVLCDDCATPITGNGTTGKCLRCAMLDINARKYGARVSA